MLDFQCIAARGVTPGLAIKVTDVARGGGHGASELADVLGTPVKGLDVAGGGALQPATTGPLTAQSRADALGWLQAMEGLAATTHANRLD